MLSSGASVCNLELIAASTFRVIDTILRKQAVYIAEKGFGQSVTCPDAGLTIQKEMVVQRKSVPETEAGKTLRTTLKQVLLLQEQVLVIEKMEVWGEMDECTERRRHLDQLADQVQVLRISLPKRLRAFLPFQRWTGVYPPVNLKFVEYRISPVHDPVVE